MNDSVYNHAEDDQKSYTPLDAEQADRRLRRLLAAYGQPAMLEPPPDVARRLLAKLPDRPPAAAAAVERRRRGWLRAAQSAAFVGVLALWALGGWGIFIDSAGPARLFGDTAAGLGYLVLALVLMAKPLMNMLLSVELLPLFACSLVLATLLALWWHLVQHVPLGRPAGAV